MWSDTQFLNKSPFFMVYFMFYLCMGGAHLFACIQISFLPSTTFPWGIYPFQNLIHTFNYNELSQKNKFQSVPISALGLFNIQRENLVFKNSLCISKKAMVHSKNYWSAHYNFISFTWLEAAAIFICRCHNWKD